MPTLIENIDPLLTDLDYNNLEASEQAKIDALLEVASEVIEKKCNRIFLAADYEDELHSGNGENYIFVNNPPINYLTSITVIDCEETDYSDDVFDYNAKIGEIRWKRLSLIDSAVNDWLGYFPTGFNNILASYNGGFDTVPTPIKYLCAEIVKECFSPGETPGSLEFEKLGQYFYKTRKDFFEQFLLANKNIINLYTIRRVSER